MNTIKDTLNKTNEIKFKELENNLQVEIINEFIDTLVKGLNVKFNSKDELRFIRDSLFNLFHDSNYFNSILGNIYHEIMTDYKRYIPFCLASILTALKNVKEKKYV